MKTKPNERRAPRRLKGKSKKLNDLVRVAALTVSDEGRLEHLATKAKISCNSIRTAIRRGYFTIGQAYAIETAVGSKVITAKQLCPEHFDE